LKEITEIADNVSVLKDGKYIGTYSVRDITLDFLISKMVGREMREEEVEDIILSDEIMLETKKLSGKGFQDVSFTLKKGEILTLTGLCGAGRTELARALFGETPATSGEIILEGVTVNIQSTEDAMNYGLGYVSEDRKELGLFLDMTIKDNFIAPNLQRFSNGVLFNPQKAEATTKEFCKKLGIKIDSIHQKAAHLSGGNQQKLCLAKWIVFNPKILIIDEPTKGVDVGAKSSIYKILRKLARSGISIIVISSDMIETLSLGTRIITMGEGRITGELKRTIATEDQVLLLSSV
jgi:ribose transport system ATP-binding protein